MLSVRWSAAGADADAVLALQVSDVLRDALGGTPGANAVVGRLCGRCGSAEHGRPWARAGRQHVAVSVSRTEEYLLTVVAPDAVSVGADVEVVDRNFPLELLLALGESAATAYDAARLWVAKEAILKADGIGLARPMSTLVVAGFTGTLTYLDAPEGCVAALALR